MKCLANRKDIENRLQLKKVLKEISQWHFEEEDRDEIIKEFSKFGFEFDLSKHTVIYKNLTIDLNHAWFLSGYNFYCGVEYDTKYFLIFSYILRDKIEIVEF